MKLDWNHWLYSLAKTVIGGAASAGAAWAGTAIGHAVSPSIHVMDWQSLGFVLATSSITNLFFYLKETPLPKDIDTP